MDKIVLNVNSLFVVSLWTLLRETQNEKKLILTLNSDVSECRDIIASNAVEEKIEN